MSGRRAGAELAFALRARELWEELASDLPEIGSRGNGSLTIVETEEELDRQARTARPGEERSVNPAMRGELLVSRRDGFQSFATRTMQEPLHEAAAGLAPAVLPLDAALRGCRIRPNRAPSHPERISPRRPPAPHD